MNNIFVFFFFFFFFFKQKTAYEIVPCDWSSDVCSSDLALQPSHRVTAGGRGQRELERGEPRALGPRREQSDPSQPPAQPRHGEPHRRVHAARTLEARRKRFDVLERRAAPPLDDGPR